MKSKKNKKIKPEGFQEKEFEKEKIIGLEDKLKEKTKLAEQYLTQLKYLQADFDNYRKKLEKEKENLIKLSNENLIKELLVILDDFDSSIKLLTDDKNRQGFLMLKNKFFKILTVHGLKKIEALGKKFNPDFHETLYKEISEKEDGEIIEEIQKGYEFYSKVLRPSKVRVSKGLKSGEKIINSEEDKEKI